MDNDSVPDQDSLWFCRDCHMTQVSARAPLFQPRLSAAD